MPINVYAVLGPAVLLLVIVEFCYCLFKRNGYYSFQDSVSSLGTAIINQCVNLFVAFVIYHIFLFMEARFAITQLENTKMNYVWCFLGIDFLFYWFHRAGHSINIMWAAHMPHHSTEELNYAVALRASVTQRLFSFIFYWPMIILGFSTNMVIEIVAFHLVLQFIPHTRVIPRFPEWIESWLNTPSHHRVHHGLNQICLDKNYGGFLIIWDKIFGSYQDESEEIFYGVTRPTKSWDPDQINFQWFKYLWRDFKETPYLWDKLRLWFMPLGWRPRGVKPIERPPVWTKETQEKYLSEEVKGSRAYIIFQLLLTMVAMFYIISDQSPLTIFEIILGSVYLWFAVKNWAKLLESHTHYFQFELIKIISFAGFFGTTFYKYQFLTGYYSLEIIGVLTIAQIGWITKIKFNDGMNEEALPA